MKNRNNDGIFNALDLAKYLNDLHNERKYRNISPLKLQKVLFFLFGEWGAFVSNGLNGKPNIGDWKDLSSFSKYLFNEDIEAWLYGPVVKEVYQNFENERMTYDEVFNTDEKKYVGEFVKDLALELFDLSDYRLVELSHQMNCWKSNYIEEALYHNNVIDRDQIINEFMLQVQ